MNFRLAVVTVILFSLSVAMFGVDVPKFAHHVKDFSFLLLPSNVNRLEEFASKYSRDQRANFVIMIMDKVSEDSCAPARGETCAKKILDSMGTEGQREGDRGTILLVTYTSGRPPEVEANGTLHELVTQELRMKVWSAAQEPLAEPNLFQVIVNSVNAMTNTFMDKEAMSDVRARK